MIHRLWGCRSWQPLHVCLDSAPPVVSTIKYISQMWATKSSTVWKVWNVNNEICTSPCLPLLCCPSGALRGHRQQENKIFSCRYPLGSL